MTIRSQTARTLTWPGPGSARLLRGPVSRATGLGLAGLLVAVIASGCSGSAATGASTTGATLTPAITTLPGTAQSATPAPAGSPSPTPGFISTGSMTIARMNHAAVLLSNGRVYIVNPAGIYFVNGCLVDVGAIYAASGHIADKDFTPVIKKALELPGFQEDKEAGTVMVGFGHEAVMSVAPKVIELIKEKKIRHLFLVAGCDVAKPDVAVGTSRRKELAIRRWLYFYQY